MANIPLPSSVTAFPNRPRASGQHAYYAARLLMQHGFDARDISSGWIMAGMMGVA
jgi:hypothetical protein